MATFDDIKSYYENILQRTPSDAEVNSWVAPVTTGALSMEQVKAAFINSPEAQHVHAVTRLYQAAFGRVPDKGGLKDWVNTGLSMDEIADGFVGSQEFMNRYGSSNVTEAFVTSLYYQVLGRAPDADGLKSWMAPGLSAAQIMTGFSESAEFKAKTATATYTFLDNAAKGEEDYSGSLNDYMPQPEPQPEPVGGTFSLTAGVDNLVGGANSDTFNAGLAQSPAGTATLQTLTAFDSIDGGAGKDTMKVFATGAVVLPTTATVKGVENLVVSADDAVTANTTSWEGLESVSVSTGAAAVGVTTKSASSVSVKGGSTVTITDTNTDPALRGSTLSTVSVDGSAGAVALNGNGIVNLSLANITTGDTTVNAKAGVRELNLTVNKVVNDIDVKDAEATSVVLNVAGDSDFDLVAGKAQTLAVKGSAVADIDGSTLTALKTITVTESAGLTANLSGLNALTAINASASGGKSTLTLSDSVEFSGGFGQDVITVGATTKAIKTGGGDDTVTMSLAVGTGGSVDGGDGIDTLAMTATNAASFSLTDTFAKGVSNFEKLGLTSVGVGATHTINLANLDNINYVSAAGTAAVVGVKEAFKADFTSSTTVTGADTITFDGVTTTLVGSEDDAAIAAAVAGKTYANWDAVDNNDGTVTFTAKATGAQTNVAASAFTIVDAGSTGTGPAVTVTTTTEGVTAVAGGGFALTNMLSNGTLELTGAVTAASSVSVKDAATNVSDVMNITLNGASNITNTAALTVSSVETINIITADSNKDANPSAASTIRLDAANATTVTVSGNHGVDFTNSTSTLATVTSLDASGVVGTGADAAAIGLAGKVTFVSTVTDKDMSIKGGNGDDVLSVSISDDTKVATIDGGAGKDIIIGGVGKDVLSGGDGDDTITGGAGADALNGGAGNDTFVFAAATDSTLANMDVISGFSANTYGNGTNGAAGTGANADVTKWTGDVLKFNADLGTITKVDVSVQSNASDAQTFIQNVSNSTTDTLSAALDSSSGKLYVDLDSNGSIDSVIGLTGVNSITEAAFNLY